MRIEMSSRMALAAGAAVLAATLGLGATAAEQTATQGQAQGQAGRGGGGRAGGAQQPQRDTQTIVTPGTGIVSGVVTTAGTGTPVRRARVTLSGTERGGRSTLTNDDGVFTFTALPAGRFTITASKAGYVDIPYGAKRPGRPGTPIQLAAGQKMERADIGLPRGGVITGMVVDENGEPAPGTQVRVMRYVMRTGERQLQTAGQDQSDDRGIYRIYGLQPGEYLVSAVPRNQNIGDLRNTIAAEIEMLMQQVQASGIGGLRGGGGGGGGMGAGGAGGRGGRGGDIGLGPLGGRGGGDLMNRVEQLQSQLAQQEQQQAVAYAPVYYPGTPSPSQSSAVTIGIGEERPGVDFQLRLVPTAKVTGRVLGMGTSLPQGTQVSLLPLDSLTMPQVPGAGPSVARASADGSFTFNTVPPGQYRVMARGNVRIVDQALAAGQTVTVDAAGGRGGRGGQGGRGGPGQIAQILWGSADISVAGQDVTEVTVSLQPGMTISGRVSFEGLNALPPTDLTRVRISISPRGSQPGLDLGGLPPATVDSSGNFKIPGVPPGRYSISANAPAGQAPGTAAVAGGGRGGAAGGGAGGGGQWVLKSAMIGGRDVLDYALDLQPNQEIGGALLTFVDRNQEVTGTIQDTTGKPTADYSIILFAADKSFWVPQSRRIQSVRPGTDGKFTFRGIPAGDYRLTAVTDVEPGEWYDPEFLNQLINASITVSVREGERKVQDIKVATGGG
jgi:hypothetical protein